jgi:hypothetical protein
VEFLLSKRWAASEAKHKNKTSIKIKKQKQKSSRCSPAYVTFQNSKKDVLHCYARRDNAHVSCRNVTIKSILSIA